MIPNVNMKIVMCDRIDCASSVFVEFCLNNFNIIMCVTFHCLAWTQDEEPLECGGGLRDCLLHFFDWRCQKQDEESLETRILVVSISRIKFVIVKTRKFGEKRIISLQISVYKQLQLSLCMNVVFIKKKQSTNQISIYNSISAFLWYKKNTQQSIN